MLFFAFAVHANNFRVADVVYLPAAGKVAAFNTDVYLSNPNAERISVSVAFAPSGIADNSGVTAVARTITVLEPGERRAIANPMQIFGLDAGFGALVFFGCREGAPECDCVASPGDCRGLSVESRIYATAANGSTTGQLFSGLPWYSYASRAAAPGYDRVFIAGVRQLGARVVNGFRTNFGVLNASQFSSTELKLTLFTSTGAELAAKTLSLGPLGHLQKAFFELFPDVTELTTGYVIVEQGSVTPTSNAAANGCADGCPAFFAYGSQLDNVTDDPTTLEAQFFASMTDAQLGCVFAAKAPSRPVRRR